MMLIAAAACSKKSETRQAPAPAPVPVPRAETPAPRNAAPAVWSVSITTMGGFSGHGKGFLTVRSDGSVTSSRCEMRLTDAQRTAIADAIASASPGSWQASYRLDPPSGMTDQFSYSFSLKLDDTTHAVSWKDESFGILPADLRRLYDTVWTVCP